MEHITKDEFARLGEIKVLGTLSAAGITLTDSVVMIPLSSCKTAIFVQGEEDGSEEDAEKVHNAIADAAYISLPHEALDRIILRYKSDYEKQFGKGTFREHIEEVI